MRSAPIWVLALAGLSLLSQAGCQHASSAAKPKSSVVHLETFVLNAVDPEAHSFLRIGIDLVVQLQDRLPEAGIHNVYFTEFLIQR